jgi:hypothetical protein
MDTVEASLGDQRQLGVLRVHTTVPDVGARLGSLRPDLVIFDLDVPHPSLILSLLKDHPGVPLLGLGVTRSTVVALSSQQYDVLTANDLAEVIQQQIALTTAEEGVASDIRVA